MADREDVQTFDPADLANVAESIPEGVVGETEDYSDKLVLPVGWYMNPSRSIPDKGITKKFKDVEGIGRVEVVTIRLNLSGGLYTEDGTGYAAGKYPLPIWISSALYARDGRPGMTSSLSEYLKAAGIKTAGMSVNQMLSLVPETLNVAVEVFIGRTDEGVKEGDTWTQANLKTKDFVVDKDADGKPIYGFTVEKDGKVYHAKSKAQNFRAIRQAA